MHFGPLSRFCNLSTWNKTHDQSCFLCLNRSTIRAYRQVQVAALAATQDLTPRCCTQVHSPDHENKLRHRSTLVTRERKSDTKVTLVQLLVYVRLAQPAS